MRSRNLFTIMAIEKTEAIIIKKQDFRETSLILTFFSKEFGKIKGLLKAARADRQKFSSPLEPFSSNNIHFYRKTRGEVHLVSHCDLIDNFSRIRTDLDKIYCAAYFSNLVEDVMSLEDKNEVIYAFFLDALRSIEERGNLDFLKKLFEIKLLSLSGFKPYLDACISCEKKIVDAARFSHKLGGLICSGCELRDETAEKISQGAVASLLHLEKANWKDSLRLKLSKSLDSEIGFITKGFLSYHLNVNKATTCGMPVCRQVGNERKLYG